MFKSALLAMSLLLATSTQAAIIQKQFSGNDCSGYFGQGFDSCTIFIDEDGEDIELSPVIAKYNGEFSLSQTNDSVYPSVDGSEYSFTSLSDGNKSGTWLYTPGAGDPGTRYWATKAGPNFLLHWIVEDAALEVGGACDGSDVYTLSCLNAAEIVFSADWITPDNKNLSHITFYDTAIIPLPAAAWLFVSGLVGFAGLSHRRR